MPTTVQYVCVCDSVLHSLWTSSFHDLTSVCSLQFVISASSSPEASGQVLLLILDPASLTSYNQQTFYICAALLTKQWVCSDAVGLLLALVLLISLFLYYFRGNILKVLLIQWWKKGVKNIEKAAVTIGQQLFCKSAALHLWTPHSKCQIGAVNQKDTVRFYMTRKISCVNSKINSLTAKWRWGRAVDS